MTNNTVINKKFSPPSHPPTQELDECVDVSSCEKIYISLVKRERELDENVEKYGVNGETIENREEEEELREREKTINGVIGRKRRYAKNVVRDRCRQFVLDLSEVGFVVGSKLRKNELVHWIIALDLAHDKTTVKQYIQRLLIYDYFYLHETGVYELVRILPKGQFTLLDPRIVAGRLRSSLQPLRRKQRSF